MQYSLLVKREVGNIPQTIVAQWKGASATTESAEIEQLRTLIGYVVALDGTSVTYKESVLSKFDDGESGNSGLKCSAKILAMKKTSHEIAVLTVAKDVYANLGTNVTAQLNTLSGGSSKWIVSSATIDVEV